MIGDRGGLEQWIVRRGAWLVVGADARKISRAAVSTSTTAQQQSLSRYTDDVGAQDAFITGIIHALSWCMLPRAPYTPGQSGATEGQ
jgi:hypothetical protein